MLSEPSRDRAPGASEELVYRLSVEQYHRMLDAGILNPDDRVELLEGSLVRKMTKKPAHRIATRRARLALEVVVPQGWYVETQEPIVTADSEPEPDVAVIRGKTEDYAEGHPSAEHVALVAEVAELSLLRDRRIKARIYARAGIPHYWVINLVDRRVEVYGEPAGAGEPHYVKRIDYGLEDEIGVLIDGVEVGRVRTALLLP